MDSVADPDFVVVALPPDNGVASGIVAVPDSTPPISQPNDALVALPPGDHSTLLPVCTPPATDNGVAPGTVAVCYDFGSVPCSAGTAPVIVSVVVFMKFARSSQQACKIKLARLLAR